MYESALENIDEKLAELRKFFPDYLTGSQEKAVALMDDFFESEIPAFILKGYAGTGKTFLLKGIAEYLESISVEVVIMAPTGRAARVISRKSGFKANTIHKIIYRMDSDNADMAVSKKTGRPFKYHFALRENKLKAAVFIIDEASMISDSYSETDSFRFGSGYLLKDLAEFINTKVNKVLFIGDPAQLPPINSEASPALNAEYMEMAYSVKTTETEMTEIVRQQAGSGLLENATRLRESIRSKDFSAIEIVCGQNDIVEIGKSAFLNDYIKITGGIVDSETIVLAHTNRQVQYYNEIIRKHYFPGRKDVVKGDRLLLVHNSYGYDYELMNGEIAEVVYASKETEKYNFTVVEMGDKINVTLEFRDMTLKFEDVDGSYFNIDCKILDTMLESGARDISKAEGKALQLHFRMRNPELDTKSQDYYLAQRGDPYMNCLRMKYGYAVTVHKAQGGEWKRVFIDFRSGFKGYNHSGYFRWAYTALTRSSDKVFAVNPPSRFIAGIERSEEPAQKKTPVDAPKPPKNHSFENKFFYDIQKLIKGKSIEIVEVKHIPGCERYCLKIDKSETWVNFWNSNKRIMHIDFDPRLDDQIKEGLVSLFSPIKQTKKRPGK